MMRSDAPLRPRSMIKGEEHDEHALFGRPDRRSSGAHDLLVNRSRPSIRRRRCSLISDLG